MKVKRKDIFEAVQWFRDGDHPAVAPGGWRTMINSPCRTCGELSIKHGHIAHPEGSYTVCPGDWIVSDGWLMEPEGGATHTPYHQEGFNETFEEAT